MVIAQTTFSTVWGYVAAAWTENGLYELSFPRRTEAEAAHDLTVCKSANRTAVLAPATQSLNEQLRQDINSYLQGFKIQFDIPLDWQDYTPFQQTVLKYVAAIPYGCAESYGTVAKMAGSPRSSRAVGGVMHNNRTPIIIPCHRVIGSNGKLVGFGGGLELKKALLLLEKNIVD